MSTTNLKNAKLKIKETGFNVAEIGFAGSDGQARVTPRCLLNSRKLTAGGNLMETGRKLDGNLAETWQKLGKW